jgi:acetolactate synthase I/II/III large subunit
VRKSGAEIFVECLLQEGVDAIFGHPGGVVLKIYDVLMDAPLRHMLMRHEQSAVHAADGYARATGRPGVCLATSGPGATNCVTGLVTANMDSIPIVLFTGQVPTTVIGNDAFQEADIFGITMPCVKHSYVVRRVEDLARVTKEAFFIAQSGKPGPVLVDIPKDVTQEETEFTYPQEVRLRGYAPTYTGHAGQIRRAAAALLRAKRPVLYVGGGAVSSNAAPELLELAELMQTPVTTTLLGLGAFPETHRLSLGMLGMHGTYWANMAMCEADLIFAVGARFDDRVTGRLDAFAENAETVIHIDIDPSNIGKNVRTDIPIVGDVKTVLRSLIAALKAAQKDWEGEHALWLGMIHEWASAHPLKYEQGDEVVKGQYVIETISKLVPQDAIITTGVGQHQMWAAQFYRFTRPRTWLTSGGLGTMGYCLPSAIGAQVAFPDRMVIGIDGDGSFQMTSHELATAVQYQLPVKIVILNNYYLGMVRQWQELFYNKRFSHSYLGAIPDYVKLAEAYGATGFRATKPCEVLPTLQQAFATPGPVVTEVVIDSEEKVYPMVPAGAALREMVLA